MLNVTEGGVKDLLYLPFNIGALAVFTSALSGGDALHTDLPSRKAGITAANQAEIIVKT
jgi:hypothetical protein